MNPWSIGASIATAAGAGIAAWAAAVPTAQLFGPTIFRTPRPSSIALTFDDGPNPAVTPQLLALLERHGVRASFFLVGGWVRSCPELAREIAARGHTIGNHTETHPNLALLSAARIEDELRLCQDSILAARCSPRNAVVSAGAVPCTPIWMRPPFGFRGPQLAPAVRRTGLRGVVMWSRTGFDWKPQPPDRLIRRLAHTKDREIVLLHDGDFRHLGADRLHVLVALEHWLPRWRDAGLDFVTIDEVAAETAGSL